MTEFDEIESLKNENQKNIKLKDFYESKVKVNEWLINDKNQIIKFRNRTEYKKNGIYHRLNGPAIEYKDSIENNLYYYKGVKYPNKEEWEKVTIKELRKIKIKKLNSKK